MITACIAQSALDYDEGRLAAPARHREIEENLWQAIRHGLEGTQIDFEHREVIEMRAALERLIEWAAPAAAALDLDLRVPEQNGAARMRARLEDGMPLADVYREAVAETAATYPPERVSSSS